jgi:hypothetical protein
MAKCCFLDKSFPNDPVASCFLAECDKSATLLLIKSKNGPPYIRAGRFVASGCATVRLLKE